LKNLDSQWHIRQARREEAQAINDLTIESKAYWGYDAAFMARARVDLAFRPEKFEPDFNVYAIEVDGVLAGFCSLLPPNAGFVELNDLFIAPRFIGTGCGKRLWDRAVERARELGCTTMGFTADPHAEAFYVNLGAIRTGEKQSTIDPTRMLPFMTYLLL
jgi:GNAT superfamily N-acetyltransferase